MLSQLHRRIPVRIGGSLIMLLYLGTVSVLLALGAVYVAVRRTCAALRRLRALPGGANATALLCLASAAAMLLLVAGCEQAPAKIAPPQTEVRYQEVSAERVTLTRELPGRISAFKVSEVRPQVGGIIQARLFEEGSDVDAGQVLYQIDPALYQAAYNNARANLGRAQANEGAARLLAERYTSLVKSNSVSRQEKDDAVAAYQQVRAEIRAYEEMLESAAINLGYTRIIAPVSGRIGRSTVTEGALVTQNQSAPLATIQQISPVYVDVTQPSTQVLKLKRALASGALQSGGPGAARVRLLLEDGSPYLRPGGEGWLEGELLFSDISVDESTGSVSLRARFENPEGLLLPGMYVRAVLVEGVLESAVLVPQRSVSRDLRNRPQVFVLSPASDAAGQNGSYEVSVRPVEIDRDHRGRWLLASGLAPGERLLVDGLQKVRPGQIVTGIPLAPVATSPQRAVPGALPDADPAHAPSIVPAALPTSLPASLPASSPGSSPASFSASSPGSLPASSPASSPDSGPAAPETARGSSLAQGR